MGEGNNHRPGLRWLGLRFLDPGLEKAFRRDYNVRVLGQVRLSVLLGSLLYLMLGLQDIWFFPQHYARIWLLRLIVAGALLAVLAITYRPLFRRWPAPILSMVTLLAGAGPILMIAAGSEDVAVSYYLGLILVVVWSYTFSGLPVLSAVACNLVLLLAHLLVSMLVSGIAPIWLITNNSNILAASLLAGFAGYLIERQRRVLFYQTTLLEVERSSQERLALSDPLTGLPNRNGFDRHIGESMRRARQEGQHLAIIFIDIDDFKRINDLYGHDAGDHVLTTLARAMQAALRTNDVVARLGGDEFVALLDDVGSRAAAVKVADKLKAALSRTVVLRTAEGEAIVPISASIGLALYPDDGAGYRSLLRQADAAMYADKRARPETSLA